MFRLIDPDDETPTALYHLMEKLFELRGTVIELDLDGGRTFDVEGPVGSGCVEDYECDYWHTALAEGDAIEDVQSLKVYAVLKTLPSRSLSIVALNFASSSHLLDLTLEGLLSTVTASSWDVWQVFALGWDDPLSDPTTTTKSTKTSSTTTGTVVNLGSLPARSATVFELDLRFLRSP